jgi:hypothetical protein
MAINILDICPVFIKLGMNIMLIVIPYINKTNMAAVYSGIQGTVLKLTLLKSMQLLWNITSRFSKRIIFILA